MNAIIASVLLGALMTSFGEKVTPENALRAAHRKIIESVK